MENFSEEKKRHFDDASDDDDFNSIYGSDVESLPEYEQEPQMASITLISWTSSYAPPSPPPPPQQQNTSLCVVCGVKPKFSKRGKHYPTCGLTCAARLEASGGANSMCVVCGVRPSYSKGGKSFPTCGLTCAGQLKASGGSHPTSAPISNNSGMCVVCGVRPSYSKGGKSYPTCGLTCADKLKASGGSHPTAGSSFTGGSRSMCVVCGVRPCHSNGTKVYPTCGIKCAERLAFGGDPHNNCEYCHRKPRYQNYAHCGVGCREKARAACLVCRSRPKNGKYHFCGKTCRDIAMKTSPLLVEARPGHVTFEMVASKFKAAWRVSATCPQVKRVYKIVESSTFLLPYDVYRGQHGNEVFRYHGTSRQCQLGNNGQTKICNSNTCPACSILRTSFNVSLANPGGAFGQGIYTSSAANKSASYSPNGIMFLNKVILGNVYHVGQFAEVTSCPRGYNSVVFDRNNGSLNETIVYRNDAIRPVFLIVFG